MLKKITKWETEDGKVFDTQEKAEDYMFEQEKEAVTHTSTEQPEALRLARWLEHRSMSGVKPNDIAASNELRRLHARVLELEASQAQRVPLTDEQIKEAVHSAVREQKLSWVGYVGDEHGRFTIPALSPVHYQLSRVIEAAHGITQEKQG